MIQNGRPSVTPVRMRLHRRVGPISLRNKKNKSPLLNCLCLAPTAAWPLIRLFPFPPTVRSSAATPCPSPTAPRPIAGRATRQSQSPAPLAPSSSVPIAVTSVADPTMAAAAHVPWRLRSSPAEPRAPTCVRCWWCSGATAHRRLPPRRPESIGPTFPPPCCTCMF